MKNTLKEQVQESSTWKSIRKKDGWNMYIPNNDVCWKIKDHHSKYTNLWLSYGRCKDKFALINVTNHNTIIESISINSLKKLQKYRCIIYNIYYKTEYILYLKM